MQLREASTVMLLRDHVSDGVEVLMVRRHVGAWAGGAFVFPGGAVDASDREDLTAICPGRTDEACSAGLGIRAGGLAFWVAAVRECFEEAGVLLARRRGEAEMLSFVDPAVAARFEAHRAALNAGVRTLVEVALAEDLVLEVGPMHHVAHWITPAGESKRYDTRFFVTAAPRGQVGLHDDREVVAHEWVRPADALARARAGELSMLAPTTKNLEALTGFADVAEVLAHAARLKDVPTIEPEVVRDGDGIVALRLPPGIDRHWAAPSVS